MGNIKRNNQQNKTAGQRGKSPLSKGFSFIRGSPRRVGGYFIRGLIIILPLAITLWILGWLFNLIDGFLAPVLDLAFGHHIPGVSFAIILVSIVLIGLVGAIIGQRRFFNFVERRIIVVPGIGAIYGGIREILNAFNTKKSAGFLEVVLVEYPRKGIYAIGLVTKENRDEKGNGVLTVYIPTSPSPAAGYLQIVPESEVIHTSMSISDAMKLIVSIGRVSKEDFTPRLFQPPGPKKEPDPVVSK